MKNSSKNNKHSLIKKLGGIFLVFLLLLIISTLIAFVFYIFSLIKEIKNNQYEGYNFYNSLNEEQLKIIEGEGNNYWIGSSNPKITIIEFGDFGCRYCGNSFSKIREISIKYKDKVKFIYRNYPFTTSQSQNLALAAQCAGEQGLFWVMHDKLFLNQGIQASSEIFNLAKGIGLNYEKFYECFNNQKNLITIQKDIADAEKLKITGTPTWFINGNRIEGDIPYEFFNGLMEKLIND